MKRMERGKEYYYCSNLEFEGDYIAGKRNIEKTTKYFFDRVTFEGTYINGKQYGIGKNIIILVFKFLKVNI